jgi:hypothetical protein
VYVVNELGLTEIVVVVAEVFQKTEEAPLAVKSTKSPVQIVASLTCKPEVSETVIEAVGKLITVSVLFDVAEHPAVLVTVTVYVVVEAGLGEIDAVVAPVDQAYVPPPVAVKVALAPEQIVPSLLVVPEVSTAEILVVAEETVTVELAVPVQPFAFETVTV